MSPHEIHRLGRLIDAVRVLAPLLEQAGRELERADLGFPEGGGDEVAAGHGFVEGFEGGAEGAHARGGSGRGRWTRRMSLWEK